jgi:hypothetical protein
MNNIKEVKNNSTKSKGFNRSSSFKSNGFFSGIKDFFIKLKRSFINFFTKDVSESSFEGNKPSKGQGLRSNFRRINWVRALPALFIFFFIVFNLFFSTFAAKPRGTYSNWNWSSPAQGFNELEHGLQIEQVSPDAPYFWSHQFKIKGGDGGYVGLQSGGSRVNGTRGKTAVFSIFGSAISGTSGSCVLEVKGFDGYNTSGTSCRIPYEWTTGRKYTLRVKLVSTDSTGKWWEAWVKDTFTGVQTSIAKIKVPKTWNGLDNWSVMWTEYFGNQNLSSCGALPYSRVNFFPPVANAGAYRPTSTKNTLSTSSTCTNSSSKANSVGGAIHVMGNTPSSTRNLVDQGSPQKVVECAYRTFLARGADPAGSTFYQNKYISSGKNLRDLARSLRYSNEGKSKEASTSFEDFIKRMYSGCLGRAAPTADITTWKSKAQSGLSREDIFVFVIVTQGVQLKS